jgi:hypothetical protein
MLTPRVRQRFEQEAELIGKFAAAYHRKIVALIDRMNQQPHGMPDLASLKLCVEALDMMLSNQTELAKLLRDVTATASPIKQAA